MERVLALANEHTKQALSWAYAATERLVGGECARSLLVEHRVIGNTACVRVAASKALGLGIIAGSAVVKVPQIAAIAFSRSAEGLSMPAYALETAAAAITFAYNTRAGSPLTTYGEVFFLILQNTAILAMMGALRKQGMRYAVVVSVLAAALGAMLSPAAVDGPLLVRLQAATIPLLMASRLPQIWTVWRAKRAGAVSVLSASLIALGSLARVYTSLSETPDDWLLVGGFVSSAVLNIVLALLLLTYTFRGGRGAPARARMAARASQRPSPVGRPASPARASPVKPVTGVRPPSSLAKPATPGPRPPSSLAKPATKGPATPTRTVSVRK